MSSFSPSDAALEGFRLTRERPRAVLAWWLVYLGFSLAILLLALFTVGPETIAAVNQGGRMSDEETAATVAKLAPFLTLAVPIELLFFSVLNCAVYRAILRPEERSFAYFRLGPDEARMALLTIALFMLWLAAVFVVALVVGVSGYVLGVFGSAATALLGAAIGFGAVGAAIWAFVRLSLAAPMTFQERRIVIFGSWSLTRGRFWGLFGAYLLAFILGVITAILMLLASSAIVAMTVIVTQGAGALTQGMPKTVSAFLNLPNLLSQALTAGMMTAFYVINLSPSAIAYQALAARDHPAGVFG